MNIEFIESHGFCGEIMSVVVDGKYHNLEYNEYLSYEMQASMLLSEIYNIDLDANYIKFIWDGTL